MTSELKPCPFCNSSLVFRIVKSIMGDIAFCQGCGARVPFDKWNERPREEALEGCLGDIRGIAYDRDGCATVESLGQLVDEIYELAKSEKPLEEIDEGDLWEHHYHPG
jgi:hypothetical protein